MSASLPLPVGGPRAPGRRLFLSPPHVGIEERTAMAEAFDSNWIAPLGPEVDAFEEELAAKVGVPHAAALSSGTAGLHLALVLLGVSAKDTVLTSSMTFAATANAIRYVGATPVFIDVNPSTWTLCPDLLEAELARRAREGSLPKAVISVDLYGQCCDYTRIVDLCKRFGVALVQDAAEALGAEHDGAMAGIQGDIGVFSFNGNKIITTSGGGMLVSRKGAYCERARFLATQARESAPHYEHEQLGFNYRMSNLLAALGRVQLRRLDAFVARRREIRDSYRDALAGVAGLAFMPEASYGRSNAWLTCVTLDEEAFGATAEQVRTALARDDIEARPLWKPMHMQPLYRGAPCVGGAACERLFERGLCLPSGSAMTGDDVARVVDGIRAARLTGGKQ